MSITLDAQQGNRIGFQPHFERVVGYHGHVLQTRCPVRPSCRSAASEDGGNIASLHVGQTHLALRPGDAVDQVTLAMFRHICIRGPIPRHSQVDRAVRVDHQKGWKVVERIDHTVRCVASQFNQRSSRSERRLDGTAIEATIQSIAKDHECRLLALENEHFLFVGGGRAVEIVATPMGVAGINQRGDVVAI